MWVNISVCAILSVLCLASGNGMFFGILLGISAAMNYCYLNSIRNRIEFSSVILNIACTAIKDNYYGTIITAYCLLFCQLIWYLLWSLACYSVYLTFLINNKNENNKNNNDNNDNTNNNNVQLKGYQMFLIFLLFVSLYWGSEVIKSLLQTTVNGIVSCWWFQPNRYTHVLTCKTIHVFFVFFWNINPLSILPFFGANLLYFFCYCYYQYYLITAV